MIAKLTQEVRLLTKKQSAKGARLELDPVHVLSDKRTGSDWLSVMISWLNLPHALDSDLFVTSPATGTRRSCRATHAYDFIDFFDSRNSETPCVFRHDMSESADPTPPLSVLHISSFPLAPHD